MEYYMLKSVACLGIFFLFYKLVLENTSLHKTKRFFLLASLLLSLAIPFITFTKYVEIEAISVEETFSVPVSEIQSVVANPESSNYLPFIFGAIYILGVLILGVRFSRNLFQILKKANQNEKLNHQGIFHVLLKLPVTPHSFFNYIFFNKQTYKAEAIPEEVIWHETAHVRQKHTWDILFVEVLQVIFWFNPLVYFIKQSIKLNHEFLADKAVLEQGTNASTYQKLLLDFSSTSRVPVMAHPINYSSFKKRFTVMRTHTSKRAAWLKGLLILPLLAVLIYGFSSTETEIIQKDTPKSLKADNKFYPRNISIELLKDASYLVNGVKARKNNLKRLVNTLHQDMTPEIRNKNINIHLTSSGEISQTDVDFIYNELLDYGFYRLVIGKLEVIRTNGSIPRESIAAIPKSDYQKFTGNILEKASPKQLSIYNKLAKKYNAIEISKRKIGWEDLKTLETIYRKMTDTQKSSALPFPECLPKNKTSWVKNFEQGYNDEAKQLQQKTIMIWIEGSSIRINQKKVSIKNFANALNKITQGWTPDEIKNAKILYTSKNINALFREKLEFEYKKTALYQYKQKNLLPPPPPPPAPDAPSGSLNNPPMPPNPPEIENGNAPPPPPPPAPEKTTLRLMLFDPPNISPQTPPKAPIEIMELLYEQGASLWNKNAEISKKEALVLIKSHNHFMIDTTQTPHNKPSIVFDVITIR